MRAPEIRRTSPATSPGVGRLSGWRPPLRPDARPERPKEPMSAHRAPRPNLTPRLRAALGVSAVGAA
ncbi:hypothetical protein GT346_20295, partial [Streptomyces sp. SID161]|nr:hypothetical protein [Streptomyces sp. SID161]